MHECPECGQACDCDGEDTWFDYPHNMACTCDCWNEDDGDEYESDEYGDENELEQQ